jgi:hypothetical protein
MNNSQFRAWELLLLWNYLICPTRKADLLSWRKSWNEKPNPTAMDVLHYNRSIKILLTDLAELNSESGPTELCSFWFDDLYFPGQSRPLDYPVAAWERGQREWKNGFSVHELEILAVFHATFTAELNKLPATAKWKEDPAWQRISLAARIALQGLE